MSANPFDDEKSLKKEELDKLKTKSGPARQERSQEQRWTRRSKDDPDLSEALETKVTRQARGRIQEQTGAPKGPEEPSAGDTDRSLETNTRQLTVSFTRDLNFETADYDLIILPYGKSKIAAEFERHDMFADGRLMPEVLSATNKFDAPYAYVSAGKILLVKSSAASKIFDEALMTTLMGSALPSSNRPYRILDCTDYSQPGEWPLHDHMLRVTNALQPVSASVQYNVILTASSVANLDKTLSRLFVDIGAMSWDTDRLQFIGLDGHPIDIEATPKPSSFRTRSHLESDQPSPNDYLGFQSVADSVAAFVQHKSTRLPLCIAVDGPWGSGKSSMMLMIQEALQKGSTKAREKLKTAPGLFGSLRQSLWLTYLTLEPLILLAAFGFIVWWYGEHPDAPADSRGGMAAIGAAVYLYMVAGTYLLSGLRRRRRHKGNQRHFETVTINAWRYGEGVRLKASIVQSIITELLERRGARFFLKLRLLRLNRMALLTSLSKGLFQSWFFAGAAIVIGLGLMIYDTQGGTREFLGAIATSLGLEAPAEHGNAILGFLLAGIGVLSQLSKNGDVANVSDFIANPDYEGLMGPDEEIEEDFRRILELLDEEGYTLAIFIDDLDRCSPTAVHKVVEALNVFFGQPDCRCLFILGMHKEMVATALEVAYSAIADKMAGNCLLEEQRPFGRRFLEKIVQFVLHVPKPREEQVETYLQHMTSGMTDADFRALAKQEADEKKPTADLFALRMERVGSYYVYLWRQLLSLLRLGRPLERTPPPQPIADRLAMIETDEAAKARLDEERERIARFEARLEAAANFTEGSDENIRMFTMVRPALGSNPRQYKRYFNQLRFNRFITEDRLPNSEEASLHTDAIMAAVALEFPEAYQWAYTNLQPRDGERNIDAALRHLKEKARKALPAHVKDLDTAKDMGDRVHYLLKQHPNLVHLIKLTATEAA